MSIRTRHAVICIGGLRLPSQMNTRVRFDCCKAVMLMESSPLLITYTIFKCLYFEKLHSIIELSVKSVPKRKLGTNSQRN